MFNKAPSPASVRAFALSSCDLTSCVCICVCTHLRPQYMALDIIREKADSEGRDWREGIDKASIEAELMKLNQRGHVDETPERVGMENRGVRFFNLTDQPLVCSVLDEDGNELDGGRHDLRAGPYQRTTTVRRGEARDHFAHQSLF